MFPAFAHKTNGKIKFRYFPLIDCIQDLWCSLALWMCRPGPRAGFAVQLMTSVAEVEGGGTFRLQVCKHDGFAKSPAHSCCGGTLEVISHLKWWPEWPWGRWCALARSSSSLQMCLQVLFFFVHFTGQRLHSHHSCLHILSREARPTLIGLFESETFLYIFFFTFSF